jgi:hypothetical protein
MLVDYTFPATVALLKFLFRLFINQAVTRVDVARALLAFPIDLAFLGLSFSSVFLGYMQSRISEPLSLKAALDLFLIYIVGAAFVTVFSKLSDSAFIVDRHWSCVGWTIPAYFLSIVAVFFSLALGAI